MNGTRASRAAEKALQAAARPSAWMTSQRRSPASRVSRLALRNTVIGLLLATSRATNSPPAAVTSATSRPGRDTTIARLPLAQSTRVSSTAPASAAPPSRLGTTISTVIGACVAVLARLRSPAAGSAAAW